MAGAERKKRATTEHSTHNYVADNTNQRPAPRLVVDNTATEEKPTDSFKAGNSRITSNIALRRAQRRNSDTEDPSSHPPAAQQKSRLRNAIDTLKNTKSNAKRLKKRIRLTRRLTTLGPLIATPLIIQLIAAFAFMIAVGLESTKIASYVIPGVFIAQVAWVIIIIISTFIMSVLMFTYLDQFTSRNRILFFFMCVIMSWTAFLFIVPWGLVWVGYVILSQK